jgi:hypothetical protein
LVNDMLYRRILPIAVLAALALAAPASANFRVGLSEQNPSVFDSPAWQGLKLKKVRYIVAWDWFKNAGQNAQVVDFMNRAHLAKQDVLVTFSADRSCYKNGRYRHTRKCRAPSQKTYGKAVKRFIKAYPWVKTYAPWNEENHISQPTAKSPKLAARYYATMRKVAKHKTVMAADVLDQSNVGSYLKRFLHFSHRKGRIWGLHNYKDVNRHRSTGLKAVLKVAPGQVWLTETGGIVTFKPSFKTSFSRSAKATKYMFSLAKKYNKRRHGNRSKVTRLYVYRWFGEPKGARFDAGLVGPDGKARKAFKVFKSGIKHRLR